MEEEREGDEGMKGGKKAESRGREGGREGRRVEEETQDKGIPSIS